MFPPADLAQAKVTTDSLTFLVYIPIHTNPFTTPLELVVLENTPKGLHMEFLTHANGGL